MELSKISCATCRFWSKKNRYKKLSDYGVVEEVSLCEYPLPSLPCWVGSGQYFLENDKFRFQQHMYGSSGTSCDVWEEIISK